MHPLLVRRLVYPLHERLKGKRTLARLRELERTQWLEPPSLRELQLRRIRAHLEWAYREVPYYRHLLDEHDCPPRTVNSLEDFARIPFLTRDLIRRHFADLQPRTPLRGAQRVSTGGSTGAPVTVLVDRERTAFTDAARLRAHRWFGVDVGAREVVLWGSPIEIGRQDRLRALRDRLINSRLLSAFDLSEAALARYARILARDRPAKLYGYASALALLGGYVARVGWRPSAGWPTVAFTTAEPLYDWQRRAIQSAFGCAVSVEYGARDAGLIATECPAGGLHIPVEGMVVEVLPAESGDGAGRGELVVTNLHSYALPIIRYRTGDVGALRDAACPCGRGLPGLDRIEGRTTDFLVTPGGRVMHALAVIYVLREVPCVREFQVIQERADRVRVCVVPDGGFADSTRTAIAAGLGRVLGPGVAVAVETTGEIARPASGKHRYVISEVADRYLDALGGPR